VIMSVEQKLAARCIQRRWRAQQYQRYLDGVPLKTQWRAADKIQGEWREYYYDRSYYFYDMWGNSGASRTIWTRRATTWGPTPGTSA